MVIACTHTDCQDILYLPCSLNKFFVSVSEDGKLHVTGSGIVFVNGHAIATWTGARPMGICVYGGKVRCVVSKLGLRLNDPAMVPLEEPSDAQLLAFAIKRLGLADRPALVREFRSQ